MICQKCDGTGLVRVTNFSSAKRRRTNRRHILSDNECGACRGSGTVIKTEPHTAGSSRTGPDDDPFVERQMLLDELEDSYLVHDLKSTLTEKLLQIDLTSSDAEQQVRELGIILEDAGEEYLARLFLSFECLVFRRQANKFRRKEFRGKYH